MPTKTISPKEESDIAKEVRDNLVDVQKADKHNRDQYRDNQKFLNGDQWEPLEAQKRRNKRLMLVADQLNGPVDQVVNSVRQNKPGVKVDPSGENTDKIDAQVMEGIIRRVDYENRAWICFGTSMECATGGNFGCWAIDIDYKNDRSFERVLKYRSIPNANETVYFDPCAIEKDRSDATWAMEVFLIPLSLYKARFSKKYDGSVSQLASQGPMSGILNFFFNFRDDTLKGWATENGVRLARYWKVKTEIETLKLYDNKVAYYDSEKDLIPPGVKVDTTVDPRQVERRKVFWYLINATEVLNYGEWSGQWIPLIPVYGRERWIEGKRTLSSMIQLAKQAQQAFNFAFTGACEVLASSTKSPWLGLLGQFKSKYNQWKTANTELHAFMEYDEVELKNGQIHVAPPEKNVQEPPIQAFLAFCNLCSVAIQRATSIFDPSLGKQKSDQSGKAIQELQEESNQGNFHWSDNLTIALSHNYRVIGDLVQQEYDAPQVMQIMRVDGGVEAVQINRSFKAGVDGNGKEISRHHNIAHGSFAYTVSIGPSYDSEMQANSIKVTALMKALPPQLIANAADLFVKLQNYGPLGDALAARLTPSAYQDQKDPQAQAAHLAQAMQQNQQLMQTVQQLHTAIATKQPELEVRKWIAAVNAIAGIEEAKIKAGDTQADREQNIISQAVDLSHQATSDMMDRQHEMNMQQQQQGHEQQMATQQQEADQNQPQPQGS